MFKKFTIFLSAVAFLAFIKYAYADVYDTATYYDVTGNLGVNNLYDKSGWTACGCKSTNSEDLVAVSYKMFDRFTPNNNPNRNSICYRQIWVWNTNVNKWPVRCTIVDRMEDSSRGENALDLTPSAFKKLSPSGTLDEGVINIGWNWIEPGQ